MLRAAEEPPAAEGTAAADDDVVRADSLVQHMNPQHSGTTDAQFQQPPKHALHSSNTATCATQVNNSMCYGPILLTHLPRADGTTDCLAGVPGVKAAAAAAAAASLGASGLPGDVCCFALLLLLLL